MVDHAPSEADTRKEIDKKLEAAGWIIHHKQRLNLHAGVAVREMKLRGFNGVSTLQLQRTLI